jgi:omega-amidase
MNFSVVQTQLVWENVEANLNHFSERLLNLQGSDVIVLPEMFSTGFSMNPKQLAKHAGQKTLNWMLEQSNAMNSAILGSTMFEENGKCFNRLFFVKPDGSYSKYDKRHLFTPGEESNHYSSGKERLIVEYKEWKICPLVCYDLRFPVFSRNDVDYDLLIYVANWPEKRSYAWQQLLKARAIENHCYVIACNRVGEDGNGILYNGQSCIVNYLGEEIGFDNKDNNFSFTLKKEPLLTSREQFPVLNDRDTFEIK